MQGVGGAASRLLQRLRRERSGLATEVPIPASHSARRRRVFRKSWYTNHFCLEIFSLFSHGFHATGEGWREPSCLCLCLLQPAQPAASGLAGPQQFGPAAAACAPEKTNKRETVA